MATKAKSVAVEVDGVNLTIDSAALEDIETLDMLDEVSGGNVLKVKKLMVSVFGDDGWGAVKEHLADGNGRVNAGDAAEFFGRVLEEYGAKN